MAKEELTIKELVQKMAGTGDEYYAKVCEVIEVDLENQTADLQPIDGSAIIYDAYLVTDFENGGQFKEPKVGSLICVVFVNKTIGIVVQFSTLKQWHLKIETTEIQLDKDGILLQRENESLKEVLNDWQEQFGKLCDEVTKIVVSIGVTPNVAAITKIKTQVLNDIKTRLNTILK